MTDIQTSFGCIAPQLLTKFPLRLLVVDTCIYCEFVLQLSKTLDRLGDATTPFEDIANRAVDNEPRE